MNLKFSILGILLRRLVYFVPIGTPDTKRPYQGWQDVAFSATPRLEHYFSFDVADMTALEFWKNFGKVQQYI